MNIETIEHAVLKQLAGTGHIKSATAVAQGDSWSLVFQVGSVLKTLKARDSKDVRAFRKLETLGKYLNELDIHHYEVDQSNYDPTARSLRRPDKARALKEAHHAAAYDKWFREQVQLAIDEADAGIDELMEHDEFFKALDAEIKEKYGKRPT